MEQLAVFGNKEEQQPIDGAKQLSVVLVGRKCDCRGYVTSRQPKSSFGTQNDKWRRRESNPQIDIRLHLENKVFFDSQKRLAADWQRSDCQSSTATQDNAQVAQELHLLHSVWPQLDHSQRTAILLVIRNMQKRPD